MQERPQRLQSDRRPSTLGCAHSQTCHHCVILLRNWPFRRASGLRLSMAWTVERIQSEWLVDGQIAVPPAAAVAAFERVERELGLERMDALRNPPGGGEVRGPGITLTVVDWGRHLMAADGVAGAERVLERVKAGDASAWAELSALYLLRGDDSSIEAEFYPPVGTREADIRVREAGAEWIYVEVTQPDTSDADKHAADILATMTAPVANASRNISLEILLDRQPDSTEMRALVQRVEDVCAAGTASREELSEGLGLLVVRPAVQGQSIIQEQTMDAVSRRCMSKGVVSPDGCRWISVRMKFGDERAEEFLRSEAKQLPKETPGIILARMSRAPSGMATWAPMLKRRFQPNLHTRVGGVCLYFQGLLLTPAGMALLTETNIIENPHAKMPLPAWVRNRLEAVGYEFRTAIGQH